MVTAAFILTKTARDALYFQKDGLFQLPLAYIGIALMSLPMAAFILWLMRLLGPRDARVAVPAGLSIALAGFSFFAQPGGGTIMTAFFMFVPLAFGVLFSLTWLLAADVLHGVRSEALGKSYAVMGASSIIGGIGGGIIAKALAMWLDAASLLWVSSALLMFSALYIAVLHERFESPLTNEEDDPSDSRDRPSAFSVFRQPYSLALLAMGVTGAVVGVIIEFQFYYSAAASKVEGAESTNLFANLYIFLNLAALTVQLGLMPRLQRRIGVYGSLYVLPLALVGGVVSVIALASPLSRSLLRIAEGGLKASVHRANWEQAFVPLSRTDRPIAKLLVDGIGARLGEGAAAVVLYFWLTGFVDPNNLAAASTAWLMLVLLAGILVWIALTRLLATNAAVIPLPHGQFRPNLPIPDT